MCYVGKATKIFIFIVIVLAFMGLILGFTLIKHGIRKSHKCSESSSDSSCSPTIQQFPNPIPAPLISTTPNPNPNNPDPNPSPYPPPNLNPTLNPPPSPNPYPPPSSGSGSIPVISPPPPPPAPVMISPVVVPVPPPPADLPMPVISAPPPSLNPPSSKQERQKVKRQRRSQRREKERGKLATIETWVNNHDTVYTAATRHAFIRSIRDGSVDLSSFKRWLGQDYIFVRKFVPFVASVLVKACKESDDESDMEVILAGLASLNDEVSWFKNEAVKWDVQLSEITPLTTNQNYCRFLESLMQPDVSYAVAMTAFWAIEAVYQVSFAHCLEAGAKTPSELKEACERWGSEGFGKYCESLQKIADRCVSKGSQDVQNKAEAMLLQVLELEVEFWNMSEGQMN